jgi:hypothetical protein
VQTIEPAPLALDSVALSARLHRRAHAAPCGGRSKLKRPKLPSPNALR